MINRMDAACGCHTGKIRKTNEDNFCFNGKCLDAQHDGLAQILRADGIPAWGAAFAVFDGMGGEYHGELASRAAAETMAKRRRSWLERLHPLRMIHSMCRTLNAAVLAVQKEQLTQRLGTTMTALYVGLGHVYVCNIGDSRAYRLHDGKLEMLSVDHTGAKTGGRKGALIQYLGIDPEELLLEPHLAKAEKRAGDRYLLCSDGLTDMLPDARIREIMQKQGDCAACVSELVEAALEQGGHDNITAIICQIC